MTTGSATTEPPGRRWWSRTLSVRFRITVAVVLLAGLALLGAGGAVYLLQENRLDDSVDASISRDLERFENIAATSADTAASAKDLILTVLASSAPSSAEVVVAFWDQQPKKKTPGDDHDEIVYDPQFASAVNALTADGGGVDDIETVAGPVRIAVKPVSDASTDGALVYAYALDEVRAELVDMMQTYALVATIALLVVAGGAYAVAGRLLLPLRELRNTARDINDSDLTRRITATGNDDLTDLTVTFNDMLDRLDAAFSTQRRFLDDVGHELKTPITIVSGHLEVMDQSDPREVSATTDLVLDEVERMGRLVEELILLAKSRRPDFLRLEPTDIATLTDSLLDKMRALGPRDWRLDDTADGTAEIDPQRVTQAVLQLAANAVAHTHEGAVIALASRRTVDGFSLSVRDEGVGISPDQQEQIFERYGRVQSDREGSGLGLAIVRAIAEAHGGRIAVDSSLGRGSTFTVQLPSGRARDLKGPASW